MYCKNCGKKLPDNARFCDRCNMSVRKIEDKKDRIVELKEERLARRQAKVVEERFRKIKKVKRKRYKNIALIVVLVVVGALSVLGGWFIINPQQSIPDGVHERETETPSPTKSPTIVTGSGTVAASATPAAAMPTESPVTLNGDGYYIANLGGISFAYPRGFADYESNAVHKLSLYDVTGDAVLIAGKTATSLPPKELMESYYADMGGTVMESRADADEYEISLNNGTQIRHRKSCVKDGMEFYYEMNYPAASSNRQQYIEYIEYMDTFFTTEQSER